MPSQTIEAVRRRARHRLIGAAILVLVGVLCFSLLFDTEPRPLTGAISIEIPSRGDASGDVKTRALDVRSKVDLAVKPAEDARGSRPVLAQESLGSDESVVDPSTIGEARSQHAIDMANKALSKPLSAPATNEVAKDDVKVAIKSDGVQQPAEVRVKGEVAEAARSESVLDAKTPSDAQRLVVQVGAFADPVSARATRLKVERAGMTTYTHIAETPSGKLIRVRVGPFSSQAEVDKVAEKIKALGLPARILAL